MKQIEKMLENERELLEKFCLELNLIAAYGNLSPALKKRLGSSQYWVKYMLGINHNALLEEIKKI
jgi:hypothetical protein